MSISVSGSSETVKSNLGAEYSFFLGVFASSNASGPRDRLKPDVFNFGRGYRSASSSSIKA